MTIQIVHVLATRDITGLVEMGLPCFACNLLETSHIDDSLNMLWSCQLADCDMLHFHRDSYSSSNLDMETVVP